MRLACPEQSVTVSAGDEVWAVPGSSVGRGEELDLIQKALGSYARILSWEVFVIWSLTSPGTWIIAHPDTAGSSTTPRRGLDTRL